MAAPPGNLVFLLSEAGLGSAGQQLLDRFVVGYPADSEFHQPGWSITAWLPPGAPGDAELERRRRDFGLARAAAWEPAVEQADAVVLAWPGAGDHADDGRLRETLGRARPGTRVFVPGVLATGAAAARQLWHLAQERRIALLAGSPWAVTWRLPELDLAPGARLREALAVVPGSPATAAWQAWECLAPLIARRRRGEAGVRRIRHWSGHAVWAAGDEGDWSWDLLGSALSRSSNPQGDPVRDGRTQDLVGTGRVRELVTAPRAWQLEHNDGLRSTLVVADGLLTDRCVAWRRRDGELMATRIFSPPPPGDHQFSRLAAAIAPFLRDGQRPWPADRDLLTAGLVERFQADDPTDGDWVDTPQLGQTRTVE